MSRTRLASGSTLLALMRVGGNSPEQGAMRHLGLALWAGILVSSPLMGGPLFTAQISIPAGAGTFCHASPSVMNSDQPASASGTCSFFTVGLGPTGNNRASAAASDGHVGVTAEVDATNPFGASGVFASANAQGFVTFTGNSGQTGSIVVNFNINFGGVLNAGGGAGDVAQAGFNAQLNGVSYGIQNASFAGDGSASCGSLGSFVCSASFAPGSFQTDPVLVPLNTPVPLMLSIFANAGNFGSAPVSNSAIADFSNSLDLPIGSDIFNLPAGFTANSTDFNIVDNRLAGTGVPEPSTFYLVCLSILVFATVRLIRQSR
jgi:hypothetical protein